MAKAIAKAKWIFEPTARHIRAIIGGETVASSRRAMLMIESSYELTYYFPKGDVRTDLLEASDHSESSGYRGTAQFWHVRVGNSVVENAAWTYPQTQDNRPDLSDYIAFVWKKVDHWYEEDEEIFIHPRNPYVRVDTIRSSRHVRVEVDGVTIADTQRPILLFETGLPTRYYIPLPDVNTQYLVPTDLRTGCPYKGFANYWSIVVNGETYENYVWGYMNPFDGLDKIRGLLAFYNEKLDIYVDGELEERPRTHFS
ncbi:MAG: DUF427 domain-containing protein [Chloroflexi bacterium]|nr:MAG: DUF427 domain-containing protein [Chloroflexota bacterium]